MVFQRKAFALLAVAMLALASPGSATRRPLQTDANCAAFAFLEIEVTGGSCEGEASADCAAVATAHSEYEEACDIWLNDENSACDSGKAEAAAWAVAEAIAEVWANAFVKVKCDGYGFACGWSISNGDAWAIAFAEAVASVAADIATENAVAFCAADIKAIASVVADVAAQAQADACTNGEQVEDFKSSYASSIQTAFAEAFATATANACGDGSVANARTKCKGKASVERDSSTVEEGDSQAAGGQVKKCNPKVIEKCCPPEWTRNVCVCSGCEGSWKRTSDYNGAVKRSWNKSGSGEKCFCP